jgi:hypothetical protein
MMEIMTDEEADALDERLTHANIELTGIPGVFAKQSNLLSALDAVSATYIRSRAEATHRTPAQIVGDMVRRELASTL